MLGPGPTAFTHGHGQGYAPLACEGNPSLIMFDA